MKNSSRVIGLVVVLGLAYTGASWYVGKQAQATVQQMVEQANERLVKVLGPNVVGEAPSVEITQYQRGVFSSNAVYTFRVKDEVGNSIEIAMKDHLRHGPLPLDALSRGDFRPVVAYSHAQLVASAATKKWFDSQQAESPVMAETRIGFDGTGDSLLQFAPVEFAQDGQTLSFSGGSVDIQFSNHFSDNESSGQFKSLAMSNTAAGETIQVDNLQLASKTSTAADSRVTMQSGASIDSVAVHTQGQDTVKFDKMTIDLNSVQTANMLDGELRYGFGQIQVGEANLGSISLGAGVKQLDVDAATDLVNAYNGIKVAHGVDDDEVLEPTEDEEALMFKKLMAVLAVNPILTIDPVLWKNAQGETQASLEVQLAPSAQAATTEQEVAQLLVETLKLIKFDLSISKAMFVGVFAQVSGKGEEVDQIKEFGGALFDQYSNRLEQAGLVKVDGDKASTRIRYENDTVEVNGQAMPTSDFIQRVIIAAM